MSSEFLNQSLWMFGRAAGAMALIFLTVSLALGIATRSGRPLLTVPRFAVQNIHRSASLIGAALVAIHVGSLLFDPYAQLRLVDLVIPFAGAQQPFWLGLGTVAFDLLIAVTLAGLLRNRIGSTAFHAIHWAAYLMWPVALVHALGTGTDSGTGWFRVLAVGAGLSITAAVIWRLSRGYAEFDSVRREKV